ISAVPPESFRSAYSNEKMKIVSGLALVFALMPSLFAADPVVPVVYSGTSWKQTLLERLPLYGHRNWIVIADSAYPDQSAPGIETIVSNADHLQVLKEVLAALSSSRHVAPIIYTDQELKFLTDEDAPGIGKYREQLHERIIAKLDEVSRTFRVLIVKTNLALPYTSVFLQLDCKYWGPDAEQKLRSKMAAESGK